MWNAHFFSSSSSFKWNIEPCGARQCLPFSDQKTHNECASLQLLDELVWANKTLIMSVRTGVASIYNINDIEMGIEFWTGATVFTLTSMTTSLFRTHKIYFARCKMHATPFIHILLIKAVIKFNIYDACHINVQTLLRSQRCSCLDPSNLFRYVCVLTCAQVNNCIN